MKTPFLRILPLATFLAAGGPGIVPAENGRAVGASLPEARTGGPGIVPAATVIPMTRAAWEKYQPLGGEFEDGRYVTTHEMAPVFEVARDFASSSNLVVEATFTPKRRVASGTGNANASIAILELPGRYWHLFLDESRTGRHTFGLTELGGTSQIQAPLPVLERKGAEATWEYGRAYRLRLALGDGSATGEVYDAETGTLLFRLRYGLAQGHVASGRPAFKFYRLIGDFERIEAKARGVINAETQSSREEQRVLKEKRTGLTGFEDENLVNPVKTNSATSASLPLCVEKKRYYRATRDASGKWWFVDPAGNPMFLSGIGSVSHEGTYSAALGYAPYARTVARKYPTLEDWATNTLSRLTSWGFNFLSSPSAILLRRGLPHAHILGIGQHFATYGDEFDILPSDGGPCSSFPNVFHPLWPEFCRFRAEFVCAQDRDDPWTLGWYIDNELSWWGDKRKFTTPPASGLFDAAAKKTPGHPAREALEAFLAERGFTDAALSAPVEVKREFVRLCARKYFEETTRAIREIDPNHLILGCRFAGLPSADPVVWEECGRFCDVVSVNIYPMADLDRGVAVDWPGPNAQLISDMLGERARMAGKPVLITEWGFSALDSGLPCTHGAGQRFFTQKERAKATSIFASTMWAMPEVAGYVYFMWCDQPAVGRNGPQSENTNYGLVNADDEPYAEQVAALSALQLNPAASRAAAVPQPHEVVSPKAEDFAHQAEVRSTPPGPSGATPLSEGGNGNAGSSEVSSTTPATIPPPRGGCREATGGVLRVEQSSLLVGGKGVFSAMLREYSRGGVSWTAATEAMTADKSAAAGEPPAPPENGVRDIAFRGETASGPFEVAIRFHEPAGRDFFIAELLSVKNSGTAPLPFESVFFRLLPVEKEGAEAARGDDVFEPPKEGQPTPIPPSLWRPWGSGAWILPDGTVLGLLTPRTTGVIIRFWRDSALHSDAQMHYPRKDLAPGETWTPDYHPFVVGGAISGGESGWRSFCDKVKTVEKK